MKNKVVARLLLFAALGPMTAGVCHALFIPGGLSPGDNYRLMFVTRGEVEGSSTDITVYNQFVQTQADAPNALTAGTTWKAVVSVDGGANARENTSTLLPDDVEIYNLGGELVALGIEDKIFTGDLLAPIEYDQFGTIIDTTVWTGSTSEGLESTGLALGDAFATNGASARPTSGRWIENSEDASDAFKSVYAMSPILKVPGAVIPIPEPTTLALFALGLVAGLGITHRKRTAQV